MMSNAGLTEVEIKPVYFDKSIIESVACEIGDSIDLKQYSEDKLLKSVFSAKITARKTNMTSERNS